MSTTIEIKAPLCRYGDVVINKAHIQYADISCGKVIMDGGARYYFPPEVIGAWFYDVADYAKIDKAKLDYGRAK